MNLERCPSPETVAVHLSNAIRSNLTHDHCCHFNRCKIVNLHVEIHKQASNDLYSIKSQFIDTPSWVTDETKFNRIYSIYLCKDTGKIHYCHANCDGERMTNEDHCQVCCISGIQYQSESVRSWKISARCVPTVLVNKQDPYMYSRDKDGRVKLSGVHNLKMTQQVMLSTQTITKLLFSKKRMQNELHKKREAEREAEKCVNKYKRYCEKKSIPKNYVHMLTIYMTSINKKPQNIQLLLKTKDEKEEIIKQYTMQLIGIWKMVLFKTILGKEMSSFFSFKSFIPACLYIMKSDLKMNNIRIIEKSRYLEAALPEANTLDLYDISKPSFTQTKNNILRAIRETIEGRLETPDSLKKHCVFESNKVIF
jgi:hypothetical protein